MRRFILIDPCLSDIGSHPYHFAIDVLEAADRAGFECEAVAHRSFLADSVHWPPRLRLSATLGQPGHSKYTAFGELDRLSASGRPLVRLAAPWAALHARRRRAERIEAFARSVEPVVRSVAAGDVVLLATASELDVAGLAREIRAAAPPRGVAWHALLHYPLYRGLADDFPRQERRLDRLRRLLADAFRVAEPHRIHLHVTTEELASQYDRLGVGRIVPLPYPVRQVRRRPGTRSATLRLSALGDARPEKHSHVLADLAERAAADPLLAGRLVFAIQSNPGFSPASRAKDHRAVLEAIHRLAAMRPGSVDLLGGPLSSEDYAAELAAADATLLAYDQERYRCRCSGILLESLASGIVPIVTGGGWMARMLAEPMGRHVEATLARSRQLSATTVQSIRIADGRAWTSAGELEPGAAAVVVRLRWVARGAAALHAAPARVEARLDGRIAAVASITPGAASGWGEAILPLAERRAPGPSHLHVAIAPQPADDVLDLERIAIHTIAASSPPPSSAAGIVVAPGDDLVDSLLRACRELATHAEHYRASSAAHAQIVADRFSGDRLVETLLAVEGSPLHPAGAPR